MRGKNVKMNRRDMGYGRRTPPERQAAAGATAVDDRNQGLQYVHGRLTYASTLRIRLFSEQMRAHRLNTRR